MSDILNIALAFPDFAGSDNWQSIGLNDEIGNGLRLLYSTTSPASGDVIDFVTILFSVDPEGGGEAEPKLLVDGSVDPAPRWAAAQKEGGLYVAVFEMAGGALNELRFAEPGKYDISLSEKTSFEDFTRPRFIKPVAKSDFAVSAVADGAKLVVFRRSDEEGYGAYTEICDGINGAVAKTASGYSALYKTRLPGPVRGNSIFPGQLHHQALDKDLKPVGEPSTPLADEVIYEVDVDVLDDKLVLFATAGESAILALGKTGQQGGLELSQRTTLDITGILSCPNLLVADGAINFCAFHEDVDEDRAVLVGYAYLDVQT